jgi:hypothetical protein
MPALIFAAFSLISVPAYVAMFSNSEMEPEDDAKEEDYSLSAEHEEYLAAITAPRTEPTSGLFQVGRLKRIA